jgi:predicted dehydrogenase
MLLREETSLNSTRLSRREMLQKTSAVALCTPLATGLVERLAATAAAAQEVGDYPLKSDRKIRIGVVGGGFGAAFQWHEDPNCIVHAVSDLRSDRREKLMKVYKCSKSYESLEKLILDKEIEAVAIFTGAPDHARHVVMTMKAGKHVTCAVPACLTLEEAQQLCEVKRQTGLTYMMAETSYYRQHCLAARKLYQDGAFGRLFYSEVEYYHPGICAHDHKLSHFQGERTWRYGYPPMLYPTHSTGLLVGVTGERLAEVSCLWWAPPDEPAWKGNVYKNPFGSCMGLFKTNRGHICRCGVFWNGQSHGERAQWFGTELTYYMPSSACGLKVVGPGAPQWTELPSFHHLLPKPMRHGSGHGGSHPFLTHEFVAALVKRREPAVNLNEALAMTVPGIVAHQSALKGGEQLKIPSFDQA